ncbi:MAG: hypothetical protein HYX27_16810 [Acidobacteria bacterium]|nr:hypothetical protein [Acidobacteriota bacterium]
MTGVAVLVELTVDGILAGRIENVGFVSARLSYVVDEVDFDPVRFCERALGDSLSNRGV